MNTKNIRTFALLFAAILVLSACGPTTNAPATAPTPTPTETQTSEPLRFTYKMINEDGDIIYVYQISDFYYFQTGAVQGEFKYHCDGETIGYYANRWYSNSNWYVNEKQNPLIYTPLTAQCFYNEEGWTP